MPKQPHLPYGENVRLGELATETTVVALRTHYELRAKRNPLKAIPPEEKLCKLAEFLKNRSIKNGPTDHLGNA